MNRKRIVIIISIFVICIGVIGGTIAYFSNSKDLKNTFIADTLNMEAIEDFTSPDNWLPGETTEKKVRAKNTTKLQMAVRISYTEHWEDQEGNILPDSFEGEKAAIINFVNEDDWLPETKNGETYYYYYKLLNPEEMTSDFMESVTFNKNAIGDVVCTPREDGRGEECKMSTDYEDATYYLNIKIEMIAFDKYKENWDTDVEISEEERPTIYNKLKNEGIIDNIKSTYVHSEGGIEFIYAADDSNGKGIYLRAGTENDEYPIYYYRGEVYNNNILFGEFCWKIVRTTETGGTKLIYNGISNNGICDRTGEETQIGKSIFNSSSNDVKYIGYTYRDNEVEVDSVIKKIVDKWYEENLLNKYDHYLEDAVWCNDRSIVRTSKNNLYYGAYERLVASQNVQPSVVCSLKEDRYTVKEASAFYNKKLNGNKLLEYPIALLTADENQLSGSPFMDNLANSYLFTGENFWLMSPSYFIKSSNTVYSLYKDNRDGLLSSGPSSDYGVRPVVSLKRNTLIETGEGTAEHPYVVKTSIESN